jgi:hypothetical protein
MGERDDAQHQVERSRERMSAIAQEVSRRMTPGYAKERAKEMARDKAYEARDRAVESSWLMPLVGAGIGALIGRAVLSRAQEKRDRAWHREEWERPARYGTYERYRGSRFGEGGFSPDRAGQPPQGAHGASAEWDEGLPLATQEYGGDEGSAGLKEQLSQRASEVSDRATEMKERLGSKAEELSGRMSDKAHELGDRVRGQASALRERIPDGEAVRASAREQPQLWALGAAAIGALFGFALPISDKEREVLEPAKQKMREATQQVMDKAVAKVEGQEDDEEGAEGDEETDLQSTGGLGTSDSEFNGPRGPEPIH